MYVDTHGRLQRSDWDKNQLAASNLFFRTSKLDSDFRISRMDPDFQTSKLDSDFRTSRMDPDFQTSRRLKLDPFNGNIYFRTNSGRTYPIHLANSKRQIFCGNLANGGWCFFYRPSGSDGNMYRTYFG